jgi:hypothetical protein
MRNFFFALTLVLYGGFIGFASPALAVSSPNTEPVRALHAVIRMVSVTDVKRMINLAKASRFNTLILDWRDGVKFKNFPGQVLANAWTREELLAVVEYARMQGLTVIPETKLLTHQKQLFNEDHPDLMFNRVTYNPDKAQVYNLVYPYLDEIILLLHPKSIDIGHDEVVGWNEKHSKKVLRAGEAALPANLFLQDTLQIHAYLKQKGIETWMWGDMMITPKEFPVMLAKNLHGVMPGYGKTLRLKLPKDIVICDWHYFDEQADFPSLAAFHQEGFRVLGSTWEKPETIRNFSRYAAKHGSDGMIATMWFHLQRKEWDVVERIIRESGETFSKDFPDVK